MVDRGMPERPAVKALAQGLGYGYQTFAHELWRLPPVVPPRAERLG